MHHEKSVCSQISLRNIELNKTKQIYLFIKYLRSFNVKTFTVTHQGKEGESERCIISSIALVLGGWLLPFAEWVSLHSRLAGGEGDAILNPSKMINYYISWPFRVACNLLESWLFHHECERFTLLDKLIWDIDISELKNNFYYYYDCLTSMLHLF